MDNPLMELDRIAQPILDLSAFGPPPSAMVICYGGGKGKTTIARVLDYLWITTGVGHRLLSMEVGDLSRKSILETCCDGVERFRLDPDDGEIAAAGSEFIAGMRRLNRFGESLAEGGYIFDFASGTCHRPAQWADWAASGELFGDGLLYVVVPVTADPDTASGGQEMLEMYKRLGAQFMPLKLVVAWNDHHGRVVKDRYKEFTDLCRYIERNDVAQFHIKRGPSNLISSYSYSFTDLMTITTRDFAARTGNPSIFEAHLDLKLFRDWLADAVASATAAGLGPRS